MTFVVNSVLAKGVDLVLVKDFATVALQVIKIHPLIIRILSMILQTFLPTLHNPSTRLTYASYVGMILTMVIIVHHGSRLEYLENSSNAITPDLPTEEPDNSLNMEDGHLSTISETKSDEVIMSSVENLVPILSESEDTSGSDSECILPSCDDFSSINVFEEKVMTFFNPLFNSNDDFTCDDESLSDEDVPEDNVKIYLNPLFEFDDEYISSDVNPLFDEVLEDIECKYFYYSNLDESAFLVTPLFDSNEVEYFSPGDDVELLLHRDPSTPMMSVVFILEGFTDEHLSKRMMIYLI
uniref:Uncharacterized protein n=1 Tax=Tanacetum cinerariifolium TaxID=118510 RepID=A0A6L2MD63_TANCI|nr:hypothetical protein [Tanacetum cinerariifolium]